MRPEIAVDLDAMPELNFPNSSLGGQACAFRHGGSLTEVQR